MNMNAITIEYEGKSYTLLAEGKVRLIRDLELARILGMKRLRDIRKLIRRHLSSLGTVSRYHAAKPHISDGDEFRATVARNSDGDGRGRPEEGFDLTEEQALFVAAKAETEQATAILKTIIGLFLQAVRGELTGPAPSRELVALQSEIAVLRTETKEIKAALDRQSTGALGRPYAKRLLKIIREQTDLEAGSHKRGSREWNRLRSSRDSALRDVLEWRGSWARCPHSAAHVDNMLAALAHGLRDRRPRAVQLRLVPDETGAKARR
jgi:hypothetical protein